MAAALRMKLFPVPQPDPGKTHQVEGVRVSILRKGQGTTSAKPDEKVAATLEFFCQTLTGVDVKQGAPEKFASIEGTLELRGPLREPVFANGPDAEGLPNTFKYEKALKPHVRPSDRLRPKRIAVAVEFDAASFEGMADVNFSNSFLLLPELPKGTLFVEIDTKIVVGGAVEAEVDVSDKLDGVLFGPVGAIVPKTSFGFELKEAGGRPPQVPLKFKVNTPEALLLEGKTNAQGQGFVDEIKAGPCDLEIPDLPPGDWGAEPKPGAPSSSHKASGDEDVPEIASKKGFRNPLFVYEATDNDQLRVDRPNLNQLAKDDALKIPSKEALPMRLPSGQLHSLTLASRPVQKLRINLQVDGVFRYELTVGSSNFTGNGEGTTLIEHEVSVQAKTGKLKVKLGEFAPFTELLWDVKMAALEPVVTDRGVQARLMNLGFDPQGVDGQIGKNTKEAISAFQNFAEIDVTGEADDATRSELEKRHDELATA